MVSLIFAAAMLAAVPAKTVWTPSPGKAYGFKSVGGVRSSADSYVVEETVDINKVMRLARDGRKLEGRSWKGYCEAFPIEEKRHIVRLGDRSIDGLRAALQEVVETDGVLLTDKENLDEALRAATYVVREDPYNGYNLKDRIFKDSDGRAEWREKKSKSEVEVEEKRKLNAKYEAQRKEQRGKPLCEVLSPDVAKEAEIEFTRQIEADTLVDAKTPKTFKLEEPIKVGDEFKEAVAREFRRIAYTGTMGWRQKLNRPAHEVAVGIWLACL